MKLYHKYFKRIIKEESWIDKSYKNVKKLRMDQEELEGNISREDRIKKDKIDRFKEFEKEMSNKLKRIKRIKLLKKYGLIGAGATTLTGAGYLAYKNRKDNKQTKDK